MLPEKADEDEEKNEGYDVDIITSPRSTGSILKPFLYASMLHNGDSLPSSLASSRFRSCVSLINRSVKAKSLFIVCVSANVVKMRFNICQVIGFKSKNTRFTLHSGLKDVDITE